MSPLLLSVGMYQAHPALSWQIQVREWGVNLGVGVTIYESTFLWGNVADQIRTPDSSSDVSGSQIVGVSSGRDTCVLKHDTLDGTLRRWSCVLCICT